MADAAAVAPVTVIVNATRQALDLKVGNHRHFADFTSVAQGARHTMRVDYNDTYQEFLIVGADHDHQPDHVSPGRRLIVTSDDCCDYKCITITETVDGRLHLHKEPRRQPVSSPPAPDQARRPAKKLRLRRVPVKKSLKLFSWGVMCQ